MPEDPSDDADLREDLDPMAAVTAARLLSFELCHADCIALKKSEFHCNMVDSALLNPTLWHCWHNGAERDSAWWLSAQRPIVRNHASRRGAVL